jgi:hypothetical protein
MSVLSHPAAVKASHINARPALQRPSIRMVNIDDLPVSRPSYTTPAFFAASVDQPDALSPAEELLVS